MRIVFTRITHRRIVFLPELRNMVGHVIVRDRDFLGDQFNVGKFRGVCPQFLQFPHRLPACVHHVCVKRAKAGHEDRAFGICAHFANATRIPRRCSGYPTTVDLTACNLISYRSSVIALLTPTRHQARSVGDLLI